MQEYGKMYKKNVKSNVDVDKALYDLIAESTEQVEEEKTDPVEEEKTGVIDNCVKAYIREGASVETDYKSIVSKGDRVLIFGQEDGWYKVITESGCDGYIRSDLVRIDQ